ncbi:MAG: glycosyltransferase family 2 protein [Vulcanimicrobiaceae bacterium]|jgi:cellulose synthase/poly-beta-1,6-N-acetylglucosamine synthase-like glycosyltransferase
MNGSLLVHVLQTYVLIVVIVMCVYAVRHFVFSVSRLTLTQRPSFQDLYDDELPAITVVVPMHNEASVARESLEALLQADYPRDRMEIIPIDDQSRDETTTILAEYAQRYPFIRPLYVLRGARGKQNSLNVVLRIAKYPIILVFDADYTPGSGLLRELGAAFTDPEVGAVMGRVVPRNTGRNLLTRLLSLERSGGYQVDQQARFNLDLLPQYGGTVGGFRRELVERIGGFDEETLAEDTDLTVRLYAAGWKVVYANRAECYEEVPHQWQVRFTQLRRWSRGHNRAMLRNLGPILRSKHLSFMQRVDGALLLLVYTVPPLLLTGLAANVLLFYMGAMPVIASLLIGFFIVGYNAAGNFAPVYEVGAAELLDGGVERIYLLPMLFTLFLFNSAAVSAGVFDTIGDVVKTRSVRWDKTRRARRSDTSTAA